MCTYMPDNEVMIIRDGLNPGDDIRIETELVALSLISENPVAHWAVLVLSPKWSIDGT